ncbi:MAG: hypothetical protein H8E17_11735 [Deltaproteobacteria bacterium]|nr:hypothetical protein [Deltaproteobacteria bacterium]
MLDVAVAYNRFKFLGDEFLTWLWFIIENDPKYLKKFSPDLLSLEIGNRIVLENRRQKTVESITIKGDDANLEEAILALKKGAVVIELNLCFKSGDQEWGFTVKGESLNISSFKTPFSGPVDTAEDIENAVIEKAHLYDQAIQLIDEAFKNFIKIRVSDDWQNKVIPMIRKWIYA